MVWRSSVRDSLRHALVEVRDPSWFADHPDFASGASVFLSGMVVNALNTSGVGNALIEFRRSETGPAAFQTFANGIATTTTETCAALGLSLDTVKEAFKPYCTEVVEVETAENF